MIFSNFSFLNFIIFSILNIKKLPASKHLVTRTHDIFSSFLSSLYFLPLSSLLRVSFFSLSLVSLTGCIGMGSRFDCNVDSGGRCAPMNHINRLVNYGIFTGKPYEPYKNSKDNKLIFTKGKNYEPKQNTYETAPIRSNEKIQQIWIGPYEDASGNYHKGSYIYAVVKKSEWVK